MLWAAAKDIPAINNAVALIVFMKNLLLREAVILRWFNMFCSLK